MNSEITLKQRVLNTFAKRKNDRIGWRYAKRVYLASTTATVSIKKDYN